MKSEKELFVKLLEKKKGSPKGKEEANQRKGTDKVWSKQILHKKTKSKPKENLKLVQKPTEEEKLNPFKNFSDTSIN